MTNILTTNPLILDTTGATSALTRLLYITSIVWDSGTSGAVGDQCVIHDASGGNIIFTATLAVAKDTIRWQPANPYYAPGFYLTTLGHGTVLIYLA